MYMISYWQETTEIYEDEEFILITGYDNHKNEKPMGDKCLGVHWGTYPSARNRLSPCVIPKATSDAILAGLIHQATVNGDMASVASLTEAIRFLNS